MSDVAAEISRVKAALQKTTSPHLRRDYMKYLKRLERFVDVRKTKGGGCNVEPQPEYVGTKEPC